ncbi:MAG: hypothetical protein ABFD79_00455 [Phycisphaerales bacterium]
MPLKFPLIIAFAAAVLYLPTLSAEFVYDDILQIQIDPYIHQHEHIWDVLTLKVMGQGVIDNNRPVNVLSLMIDSMMWGKSPFAYHLTNLLLHSISSAMAFVVFFNFLKRIFGQDEHGKSPQWAAFIGAMLFAIHPINSEAVCVPSFREDLLVAFFTLLTLVLAEYFPAKRKIANLLVGFFIVFFIFAAAGSKESGAAAPLILLLYWLFIHKMADWRKWAGLLTAGFSATLIFFILRFTIVAPLAYAEIQKAAYPGGSFARMLTIQPRIWLYQICELFWPNLMCADLTGYPVRIISLQAAIAGLSIICIAVVLYGRKNRMFSLGMIFFVIAMLPTSNFIPIYWPIADRYLYFPMIGICMAVSGLIYKIHFKNDLLKIAAIAGGSIIALYACCFTIERQLVWHSELSLWSDTVKKNPYSFTGNYNLGFAFYNKGYFENALSSFAKASEIMPYKPSVKAAMAMTCDSMEQTSKADEYFKQAVSLNNPDGNPEKLIGSLLWTHSQVERLQKIADRVAAKR